MQASTWLSRALDSFRESGIPERQRLQLLEELQDHFTDLQEANMSGMDSQNVDQLMGSPESVASALAESYRSERLLVRQPWLAWLAFALGPIIAHLTLTICLSCLSCLAAGLLLTSLHSQVNLLSEETLEAALSVAIGIMGTVAGVGVAAWFCMAARRNRLSWRMSLLSCLAQAIATPILLAELIEPQVALWVAVFVSSLASLATWYWMAWRGQRWKEPPVSMSRRYPFLLSGLGSLTVASLCLGVYLLLVGLFVSVREEVFGLPRNGEQLWFVALSCKFVPFALAAYLCWRMTQRCPRQLVCSFVACLIVAVTATIVFVDHRLSHEGQWQFVFGIVGGPNSFRWSLIGQFLAPLAIWGVLVRLARQQLRPRLAGPVTH